MKKTIEYTPQGVCAKKITIAVEDNKIVSTEIVGGCHGNLQGICTLMDGMDADQVIDKLEGIDCRGRGTSCPDQIALALKENK